MADPLLFTLRQVAERLGVPLSQLYRRIRKLRDQHGFPAPVPGVGNRYDPLAIEAWLTRQRGGASGVSSDPAAEVQKEPTDLAEWQAALDRRAAAIAGRRGSR